MNFKNNRIFKVKFKMLTILMKKTLNSIKMKMQKMIEK